ncbi:MAG: DNA topoisomerase, partial [Arthrobacter sp.]|nr:DNA topoisomerase [Arthrobacter sp.]
MRLRRSNASGRGYRRVAAGKGFSYRDLDGSTLPPGPVRDRLESIG